MLESLNRNRGWALLVFCVALASMTPLAFSQGIVYGSIFGTVTDPTGAGVPNAKVTIEDIDKGTTFDATTNETGNYTRDRLLAGTYKVTVEGAGFQRTVVPQVVVNVNAAARADVSLRVGDVTQTMEVNAEAPLLQSDKADVQTTYTSKQLVELPTFSRNLQATELLMPGTNRLGWQHASSENPQGSVQIQVNGQHFSGTDFQLDGTSNQDPILGIIVINPNIDSVTETRLTSQNYDAEFGLAGSGLMLYTTKSGTNELHGSAFEFNRTNSPNFQVFGRDPFSQNIQLTGRGDYVPPQAYNQFGGSIGGPIKKNKLFVFGDAQLNRERNGSTVKTSVPTALARTGNFSEYVTGTTGVAYDPLTGNPTTGVGRTAFPNNTIPTSRISPQAAKLLTYFPLPNAPGDPGRPFQNNYVAAGSEALDSNRWDVRGDYFINEKSSAFGRYSEQGFNKSVPGAFGLLAGGPALNNIGFAGVSDVTNRSIAAGYTRTINPTLITDFRFGYMHYGVNVLPNGLGTSPAQDAGIPNLNKDAFYTSGMPQFQIIGFTYLGYGLGANQCNCPLNEQEKQFQIVNNTTKILGNHSIKVGVDLRWATNLRVPSDNHRSGELNFNAGRTGFIPTVGANPVQGLSWATFLLGDVSQDAGNRAFARYVSSSTDAMERQKRFFLYAQDSWRVTPKLSVNYGLRWEMIFPETINKAGNAGQLDLRTGNINVFGVGGVSDHGIQEMNWRNFAPRLGITYQLTPKTVVRAGYGWSYELGTFGSLFGHNVTQNLPVLAVQALQPVNSFTQVFNLAQGPPDPVFPTVGSNGQFRLPDGVAGKARPLDVRLPRVMAFNATVERQLTNSVSLSVGYVGNRGRHVFAGDGPDINANAANFIPGLSNTNLAKPYYGLYGWTSDERLYCNCATNSYDSLQSQLKVRFSQGLLLQLNYTYQVAKGDDGDDYTFNYNRPLGYGTRDGITDHAFTATENYEVPFGKGKRFGSNMSPVFNILLGGWTLNGITSYYSGRPFTPGFNTPDASFYTALGLPASYARPYTGPSNRPNVGTGDVYSGVSGDRNQFIQGLYKVPGNPASGLSGFYALPASNTYGNFPIRGLRGPIFIQQDVGFGKGFALREKTRLQIRAEFFNIFNHTNLGDPNGTLTDVNVGQITGLAPGALMRRLQFGARLDF